MGLNTGVSMDRKHLQRWCGIYSNGNVGYRAAIGARRVLWRSGKYRRPDGVTACQRRTDWFQLSIGSFARAMAMLFVMLAGNEAFAEALRPGVTVISPAKMPRIATIDERFQSYNIEMIEVTGGRFWKPYVSIDRASSSGQEAAPSPGSDTPAGMDAKLYDNRAPIDLANVRLRKLAAALAPAYVRVSGTWANTTYFSDSDAGPSKPPAGFKSVLTPRQWRGVIDFAGAVDARIVTSFAISAGVRDRSGVWTPDQARRVVAFTRAAGSSIAAAELMNEPDLAAMGGAPPGYDAKAYGRDFKVFHEFAKRDAPRMMILGPGTVTTDRAASDLFEAIGDNLDAVSYHHYGALSERCTGASARDVALSEQWLSKTDTTLAFYRMLRDRFEPGKPIWLTETADAACGGNRSAATFLDTFRYLDQLGRLAKAGVQVVMHNTFAASDYGLIDETTLTPRPNYWGALLWRRLMGTTVLNPGARSQAGLHVYAHCLRGVSGGVALLVINTDRDALRALKIPNASRRYTFDAESLDAGSVRLNGHALALGGNGDLPRLAGAADTAGVMTFAPATITFLAIPAAKNRAC
jgi:heparanase 1